MLEDDGCVERVAVVEGDDELVADEVVARKDQRVSEGTQRIHDVEHDSLLAKWVMSKSVASLGESNFVAGLFDVKNIFLKPLLFSVTLSRNSSALCRIERIEELWQYIDSQIVKWSYQKSLDLEQMGLESYRTGLYKPKNRQCVSNLYLSHRL